MDDDRILVAEILAGNQAAFQTFVEKFQRLASHIIFRLVRNETEREDLCQEVFLKAYTHLDSFRFNCRLSTWVGRIAHNVALNYLEKKKLPAFSDLVSQGDGDILDRVIDEDQETPEELAQQKDIRTRVCREVDALPPLYGVLIALYHLENMSYAEIADVINLPMGTVKNYLFRAREQLRQRLAARYQPEEIWK